MKDFLCQRSVRESLEKGNKGSKCAEHYVGHRECTPLLISFLGYRGTEGDSVCCKLRSTFTPSSMSTFVKYVQPLHGFVRTSQHNYICTIHRFCLSVSRATLREDVNLAEVRTGPKVTV